MNLNVKRAYEAVASRDGFRVLVDRLWPRGVSKKEAQIDLWAKEVAPSAKLRSWFHVNKEKRFKEFTQKYTAELAHNDAFTELKKELKSKKVATIITAAKDVELSHVSILLKKLK